MAREAPGGAGIHVAGGERVEAKRFGVGVDVLGDGFEAVKVLQLVHAVARRLDERGVDDDAVALEAVADGDELAVFIIEVIGVGVELLGDGRARQIERIVRPVPDGIDVAHDVERGGIALIHLGGERLVVRAGGGGDDLHLDAGLFLVQVGDLMERLVGLGLEVEPVDRAGLGGGSRALLLLLAAGGKREEHEQGKRDCKSFFHNCLLLFILIIFTPKGGKIRIFRGQYRKSAARSPAVTPLI